jgi:hypothetical protein
MGSKKIPTQRSKRAAPLLPDAGAESAPDGLNIWAALGNLLAGKAGWFIGAPLLVFACGFMLMWWSFVQQSWHLLAVQERATQSAQATLVDRYYLLEPTDVDARPQHSDCDDGCLITPSSVAVFEFTDLAGRPQRVEFMDWYVHDWQHNTAFELGVPILQPTLHMTPEFHAFLVNRRLRRDPAMTLWDDWWTRFDDAAHWLLRVRDPLPTFTAPLRYDPADPTLAVLDLPPMRAQQASDKAYVESTAWGMALFVAVICWLVLWPAVKLMLYGAANWVSAAVAIAIVLAMPLWAPFAERIAPQLSEQAGMLARGLKREFGRDQRMPYLAQPVTPTAALREVSWSLAGSRDAAFVVGFELAPPAVEPLDHAGALDALQASLDLQLRAMSDAEAEAALAPLNHYEADRVLELFVPALLHLQQDERRPDALRATATKLLGFFVREWSEPTVDTFLFEHRLGVYERLAMSSDAVIAEAAVARLAAARERIDRLGRD